MRSVLEVQSLTVRRRRKAVVDDLSFEVPEGARLAILGPNGAGKTTALRAIALGDRRRTGTFSARGVPLGRRNERSVLNQLVGYQPQTPRPLRRFTVLEAVEYSGWLKGVPRAGLRERVEEALEATNLGSLATQPCRKLSGGQLKRVAISQALVHRPNLILLDEPTAALDPEERINLLALLDLLPRQTAVVYTTHLVHDLTRLGSHVLVMANGSKRYAAPIADFLNLSGDLDEAYTRSLAQ